MWTCVHLQIWHKLFQQLCVPVITKYWLQRRIWTCHCYSELVKHPPQIILIADERGSIHRDFGWVLRIVISSPSPIHMRLLHLCCNLSAAVLERHEPEFVWWSNAQASNMGLIALEKGDEMNLEWQGDYHNRKYKNTQFCNYILMKCSQRICKL